MLRCEKPIPDKNGNGRISVREYVKIFSEHGIAVAEDEVRKVSELANENGEVTKDDFLHYAKTSDFFRQQEYPTFPFTNVISRIRVFYSKMKKCPPSTCRVNASNVCFSIFSPSHLFTPYV